MKVEIKVDAKLLTPELRFTSNIEFKNEAEREAYRNKVIEERKQKEGN